MLPSDLLQEMSSIRVILHKRFYTPSIILEIQESLKNNCHISSLCHIPSNNCFQIQFRKTLLKKVENPDNSIEFYTLFNDLVSRVFYNHKQELINIFIEEDKDPNIFNDLTAYVDMVYSLIRVSSNSVILYL